MSHKYSDAFSEELFKAILKLETVDECKLFFKDLCTYPEVKALSQRYVVAKMLYEDEKYADIVEATGASTATISRVKRSLDYENAGGYDLVFSRLNEDDK